MTEQGGPVVPQPSNPPAGDIVPSDGAVADKTMPVVSAEQLDPRPRHPPGWHQYYEMDTPNQDQGLLDTQVPPQDGENLWNPDVPGAQGLVQGLENLQNQDIFGTQDINEVEEDTQDQAGL